MKALLLAFLLWSIPASADEARDLFRKGLAAYSRAEYAAAVRHFKAAYEQSAAPGLLFNIAQACRLAGDDPEALHYYRTYLRLNPEAKNRADVEAFIAELAPASAPAPAPSSPVAQLGTPTRVYVIQAQPRRRSRALLWPGVGTLAGGLALLGSAIGVGVAADQNEAALNGLARRNDDWSQRQQARFDEGQRLALTANILYGVSAAVLVTGTIITWVGARRDVSNRRFGLVPNRGGAQGVLSWTF